MKLEKLIKLSVVDMPDEAVIVARQIAACNGWGGGMLHDGHVRALRAQLRKHFPRQQEQSAVTLPGQPSTEIVRSW